MDEIFILSSLTYAEKMEILNPEGRAGISWYFNMPEQTKRARLRQAEKFIKALSQEELLERQRINCDLVWDQIIHAPSSPAPMQPNPREDIGADPGFVYMLHCEGTPYYKIGRTTQSDPKVRIAAIQTMCPLTIETVCFVKTGNVRSLENYLHRYASKHHHRREWFAFSTMAEASAMMEEGIKRHDLWIRRETT